MARLALLCLPIAVVVAGITLPAPAQADEAHASARKPKKKRDKKKPKKRSKSKRSKELESEEVEISIVGVDPPVPSPPTYLQLGQVAITTPVPEPPYVAGSFTTTPIKRAPPTKPPTWFLGVRGGPALIDRRGYYNFRSNRQTYHEERNARGEVLLGRYLGRHVSLGLVGGTGPYPKFDEPDPLFGENTRFSVYLFHGRLDLDLHAGPFVLGIGGGGAYEYTTGTFAVEDPSTLVVEMHTATFRRFGLVGAARTGFQVLAGPFALELLAEATVLKLFRGTYQYTTTVTTEGPSDREKGYAGSLLLGLRLQ
jgi:hypothetical protein